MSTRTLLVLLLALPIVAGEDFIFDSTLYSAEQLTVDVDISSTITMSGQVNELTATLNYAPKETSTQAVEHRIPANARLQDGAITYTWKEPDANEQLTYHAQVTSRHDRPALTRPIAFPYRHIAPEAAEYLGSEDIIGITPDIEDLAADVVGDETNAVRAVFLMGRWVKDHITYDLNTVTADAAQTAQWTLDNRYGVCDELTSLFIALLRSQGIPARFVSGVAYTNLEELDTQWGPHGWAEVWYPDVGWVPYDITYGQFGYVDATHITFDRTADATSDAIAYTVRGVNAHVNAQGLQRDVTLVDREGTVSSPLQLSIEVALDEIGPDGANRVDATLYNPSDAYIAAELFLARTQGIEVSDYTRSVLLGPRERVETHWVVQLSDDVKAGYTYTFPIVVNTDAGQQASTEFSARSSGVVVTKASLDVASADPTPRLEGVLECDAPEEVKAMMRFTITCTHPTASRICLDECVEGKTITQDFVIADIGAFSIAAQARNGRASATRRITVLITDDPRLAVQASMEEQLSEDMGSLRISLARTSQDVPEHVFVKVLHPLFSHDFTLDEVRANATLELEVPKLALHAGDNEIDIIVSADEMEDLHRTIHVTPRASGAGQWLQLWLNSVASFLS